FGGSAPRSRSMSLSRIQARPSPLTQSSGAPPHLPRIRGPQRYGSRSGRRPAERRHTDQRRARHGIVGGVQSRSFSSLNLPSLSLLLASNRSCSAQGLRRSLYQEPILRHL